MTPAVLITIAPTLGKLIRMLSSDKDGEIVASVHALRRVLAGAGLTLHDLADAIELPAASQHDDGADHWRAMAQTCAHCSHLLSQRERVFVMTMTRWRGRPSRKQSEWLQAIYERVREAA